MHEFERELLEVVQANCDKIESYVEEKKGIIVEVSHKDHFPFQFGPITSLDAQNQLYDGIFNAVERNNRKELGPDELPSIFTDTTRLANLEIKVSDRYVPTAIKNAICDVLKVDDNEGTRLFKMGPVGSTLPLDDDFTDMLDMFK